MSHQIDILGFLWYIQVEIYFWHKRYKNALDQHFSTEVHVVICGTPE